MTLHARTFAILLSLLALGAARAQSGPFQRDIDLVVFKPTPSSQSGITLEGAQASAPFHTQLELALDFNDGLLAIVGNTGQKVGDLIPYRIDAHLMGAAWLLPRLEVGIDLPLTLYQGDGFQLFTAQGFPQPGVHAVGLGDLRLLPRYVLLDAREWPVGVGATAELRFPTGDGQSFLGGGGLLFAPRVDLERVFGPFRLLVNLGIRIRSPEQYLNLHVGDELVLGVGGVLRLPDLWKLRHIEALAEMNLATSTVAPFTITGAQSYHTPWEILLGLRARIIPALGAELDVGRGMTGESGYGREAFRVIAALRYDFDITRRKSPPRSAPPNDPNQDSDGDGIPDREDSCPLEPGPAEYEGCPDRDEDQIPDNVDKCPDEAGPADNDGCPIRGAPLVSVAGRKLHLSQSVLFEIGKAVIQKQSFKLLDAAYRLLAAHPELGRVQVEGHTDNRGPRALNQDLSERRAAAVVAYLVKKGLPAERFSHRGFGFDRPIATNDTIIGRARNRRVEFTLIGDEPAATSAPGSHP